MNISKREIGFNIAVFLILLITISVGMFYAEIHLSAPFFYPAAGVYISIYYIHRKRFLYTLLISIFITIFIWRAALPNEGILISLGIASLSTLISLVEMYLFTYLIDVFKCRVEKLATKTISLGYFFASVITGAISGVLGTGMLMLFFDLEHIFDTFIHFSIGTTLGIIIFGALSFSSNYHDPAPKFDRSTITRISIYIIAFILNMIFIFGNFGNNFISFANFQMIIFVLYIFCAFAFSYRMISVSNLIFLVLLQVMYLQFIPDYIHVTETVLMATYVLVLSSIASVVRNVMLEKQKNTDQLKQARNNLDNIILSTNKLLSVEDRTPNEVDHFSTNYFIDMFHLACDLYPKFQYAACYVRENDKVKFIATYNFDMEFLNSIQFDANDFDWNLDKPIIQYQTKANTEIKTSPKYKEYKEKYGDIKSSIRFTINIGEGVQGGMSFDIPDGSNEIYDQMDVLNFESFQNLMNGYYSIGILNNQNETLKDDIVRSIVSTLELYDSYTESHSDEVSKLCMALAEELHLNTEQKRELYWSSLLHDIGKIGISANVLNKPGRLNDEEYEIIRQHPLFGYEILSRSETLSNIAINVKHHHEWYNGSGYPDGLEKDEIPYLSQIIHVCDAVSAMSNERVYKPAMTETEIIKEIKRFSGAQFNPKLAEIMIEFIENNKLSELFHKIKKRDNL